MNRKWDTEYMEGRWLFPEKHIITNLTAVVLNDRECDGLKIRSQSLWQASLQGTELNFPSSWVRSGQNDLLLTTTTKIWRKWWWWPLTKGMTASSSFSLSWKTHSAEDGCLIIRTLKLPYGEKLRPLPETMWVSCFENGDSSPKQSLQILVTPACILTRAHKRPWARTT